MRKILENYKDRIPVLSAYYFLSNIFKNKVKFTQISDEEFFNIVIQLLLFMLDKTIKKEVCFKEDLTSCIESINSQTYKKNLSYEEIEELTSYILNGLRNKGKGPMSFEYYNVFDGKIESYNINFINDKLIKTKNNNHKLSYTLTNQVIMILLATKEYDDIYQIQIGQMMAKLRIKNGDFIGAREEIKQIISRLHIQQDEMANYLKCIGRDLFFSAQNNFNNLLNNSLEILKEEIKNYEHLKLEILSYIETKEILLNYTNTYNNKEIHSVLNELNLMKEVVEVLNIAKYECSKLIDSIQNFRIEYFNILEKSLIINTSTGFNFKEVILDKIESSHKDLSYLDKLFLPFFKLNVNDIFTIDTPYQEQKIQNHRKNKVIISKEDWGDVDLEKKKIQEDLVLEIENYYYLLVKEIVLYSHKTKEFSLKEFLNYYISNDQTHYIELTKNSLLFRHTILTLLDLKKINIPKIKVLLKEINFNQSKELQVERIFQRLFNETEINFENMYINQINGEKISINTEINLSNMTSTKLIFTNINFKFD